MDTRHCFDDVITEIRKYEISNVVNELVKVTF